MRYYFVIALIICCHHVFAAVTPCRPADRAQPTADTIVRNGDSFSIRDRSYFFTQYLRYAGHFKIGKGKLGIAPLTITYYLYYPNEVTTHDTAMLNVTLKFFAVLIAGSVLGDSVRAFESVNICCYDPGQKRCKYYKQFYTQKLLTDEWKSSMGKAVIFADAILDAIQPVTVDTVNNEFTYIIPADYNGTKVDEYFESRSIDLGRLFYVYVLQHDRRFNGVSFTFQNADSTGKVFKKTYRYSRYHAIFKNMRKVLQKAAYPASLYTP